MNFQLRLAIDRARAANMPNDNVDRAIKAGAGELKSDQVKEVLYEGFGPGGVAVLVQAITDNTNRTAADMRHLFSQHGGSLGGQNSVAWMFERRGVIRLPAHTITNQTIDDFGLQLVDVGAEDVSLEAGDCVIITSPEKLQAVREWLLAQGYAPQEAGLEFVPTTPMKIDTAAQKKLFALFQALEEHDDADNFFSNAE